MTADAKVGLLLGLFFIVLIAFLINGLPTFLQSASADDMIKTTSVVAPSGPDLVIDHRVTETAQRLIGDMPLRTTEPPQEVIVLQGAPTQQATAEPPVSETPSRHLPTASVIAEQVNRLQVPQNEQPPASASTVREHIVQRGENLAVIAQRYYGAEEGNRRAIIQKLYEANKDVLDSPDRVIAGAKLVIPSLTEPKPAQTPPSESLLQRFSNMFERAETQPRAARQEATAKTVEYIVQSGDSLWKIAERTLGDGSRFHVLVEMNKDRLKSPDDVVTGMTLIVPAP